MTAMAPISRCRGCGGAQLTCVLDLGEQALSGVFPASAAVPVTRGPLQLLKCDAAEGCGLLQLAHSYDVSQMYGANYGYRSGLNPTMVAHLHGKVARLRERIALAAGDLVVDIGANDGTTLRAW